MTGELLLVSMVQRMARETVPGLSDAEAGVRGVALDSFAGGASVGEACREARLYLRLRAPRDRRKDDLVFASIGGS
jgi:hypothetical protein